MDIVAKLEKMAKICHQMKEDIEKSPTANLNDSVRKIDPELADRYYREGNFSSISLQEDEIELTSADYEVL